MRNLRTQLIRWLATLPKASIMAIALFLIAIIGFIDYIVLLDVSLSIFYLIPIVLATWFIHIRTGILLSAMSAGIWFWAEFKAKTNLSPWNLVWNSSVRLCFFLTVIYLLWEVKCAYEREKKLARTDGLTGAVNQRFFLILLHEEVARCQRFCHPLTLAYFDLDNFKTVNDRFGHSQGNELLCLITETINHHIRAVDTLARLGGDEFAILLPETNYEAAKITLNRLHHTLLRAIAQTPYPVSLSMGAVTFQIFPDSLDQMLEMADQLMYKVKQRGKNGIEHHLYQISG